MANKAFTTSTKKGTMKCAQENPRSLMIQVSLSNTSKKSEYGKAYLNIHGIEYRGIVPKITLGKRKARLCRAQSCSSFCFYRQAANLYTLGFKT